jgi:LAO/AO transport system kinase
VSFAEEIHAGNRLALARLITMVENNSEQARKEVSALHPFTGQAKVIGITGPPGAGKSTLTGKLIGELRKQKMKIAVVAVDPTSPFTGGALLGDRLRMTEFSTDPNVYIRSMSTRGNLGGLAGSTADVVRILDAAGFDYILVETVGVGQAEVDIMGIADTVLVITVPGLGDDIQANKAGIMEIGDVFVVNKADRDGADQVATALGMMLDLNPNQTGWRPPVIKSTATTGEGVAEIVQAFQQHHQFIEESGLLNEKRRERTRKELIHILQKRFLNTVVYDKATKDLLEEVADRVYEKSMDPYQAVDQLWRRVKSS